MDRQMDSSGNMLFRFFSHCVMRYPPFFHCRAQLATKVHVRTYNYWSVAEWVCSWLAEHRAFVFTCCHLEMQKRKSLPCFVYLYLRSGIKTCLLLLCCEHRYWTLLEGGIQLYTHRKKLILNYYGIYHRYAVINNFSGFNIVIRWYCYRYSRRFCLWVFVPIIAMCARQD